MNKNLSHEPKKSCGKFFRACLVLFFMFFEICRANSEHILVPVRRGDCLESFSYSGELEAIESADVHAPDLRETNLMTVKSVLEDGTKVLKGDIVVQIDDGNFQIALESAKNELELASSEFEKTKFELDNEAIELDLNIQRKSIDLEKAKATVVEGLVLISKIELKKAKLSVELSKLEHEQAKIARADFNKKREATLKVQGLKMREAQKKILLQKENIEKSAVRAPRDGIVYKPFVRLNNEMGRIVANKVVRPGDKLLELPEMSGFHGVVFIPSADYQFINPNDSVNLFFTILPDRKFSGRVKSKELYPMSRNERLGRSDAEGYLKEYKALIDVLDQDTVFRPGLTFRSDISCTIASNCLYIPRAAIVPDFFPLSVWIKGATQPEKKAIIAGKTGVNFLEVVSGLRMEDQLYLDFPIEENTSPFESDPNW
ncbi:HlyD family efflux transporter periplasmic adaptor subunit [bacterium]|nr:HlyD family efflux transporter periplasmic adaptor subunit [bacterium]